MKTKLFTLFIALTCATSLFASDIQVDGIWYNFYSSTKTAEVTYRGSSYSSYEDEYSGSVVIPETVTYNSTIYSVTTIGNSAFRECKNLTSVTIPNSVTTIGNSAFQNCTGLISVSIGNSVTTIGKVAFSTCTGLTSINVDAANTHYCSIDGVLFNYAKNTLIQYPRGNTRTEYAIPNSVTTIGNNAFYFCEGLTSVTIPNSVTTIGEIAFYNCTELTSITIPNSVSTIGDCAFYGCSGLTSVTIGNSVTTIGGSAFNECSSLKKTNYTGTIAQWCKILFDSHANPISYSHNFFINNEEVKNLVIPQGVDMIRNYAFYGCSSLTSVTIPNSVTTIGNSAFYNCSGLTSITIPYSVSTIGITAFYGCSGLKKTNYTGTIADWCKIKFEFKVKVIGGVCSNPMVYSNNFFINDIEVKDLVIPQGVDTISAIAFYRCSSLTSITIPNSVTTIGDYAFSGCSRLTSVTIPNSVTTIGNSAFSNCYGLTSITCYAVTPPECGDYAFSNILQDAKVYVPASALTDYQNAEVWKDMQLFPIAAEVTPMDGDNPIVTPTNQDVTITWPITDGTDTYTLTITKNGEVVCVLTFNANGQLTNIAFAAPGHNGTHQAPAATLTAQGYQFTVTGLNPGTAYDYSVTATDAGGKTLAEHKGNFSTTGGTGFKSVHDSQCTMHKYFHNGNLIIERNGIKYTPAGQKVK